jgi:hypothetical protein
MELFLQPEQQVFEKVALEVSLPEDPNVWPQEVLQELYKQVPYISDFDPHIVMDRVEAEQGYGVGYVEVMNKSEAQANENPQALEAAGIRQVRIPVIIKGGKLQSFDLIVTDDSKALPLTEMRLRAAIFRPQAFDITSQTPGDQSMIGQLYPPYRQNYGFGGSGGGMNAGMGKEGSVYGGRHPSDPFGHGPTGDDLTAFILGEGKTKQADAIDEYVSGMPKQGRFGRQSASGFLEVGAWDAFMAKCASSQETLLQSVLPTVNADDHQRFCQFWGEHQSLLYKHASAIFPSVKLVAEYSPHQQKTASVLALLQPTVTQVSRAGGGHYNVKTAHPAAWDPAVEQVHRGELVRRYGVKLALEADMSGGFTVGEGAELPPEADSDAAAAEPISETGMYRVHDTDGLELVGAVLCNLMDVDGTQLPLCLFTNGSQTAIQADIVGTPVEQGDAQLPTGDAPSGKGFFFGPGGSGIIATIPLNIRGSYQAPQTGGGDNPIVYQAETFDGRQVIVSRQPAMQAVKGIDSEMLVPDTWQWSPLKGKAVTLTSAEVVDSPDAAAAEPAAPPPPAPSGEEATGGAQLEPKLASARHAGEVVLRSAGGGEWTFSGYPVEKLAYEQVSNLKYEDAIFLLAGLGVDLGTGVEKLAASVQGHAPVRVKVAKVITPAADALDGAYAKAAAALAQFPQLRCELWKEAAEIPDPTAVDTVLSLGFLSPENLMTFVGYLPTIEESQRRMCELLLVSRLGMAQVSQTALERAVRSTEEVIEGLKALAFQQN